MLNAPETSRNKQLVAFMACARNACRPRWTTIRHQESCKLSLLCHKSPAGIEEAVPHETAIDSLLHFEMKNRPYHAEQLLVVSCVMKACVQNLLTVMIICCKFHVFFYFHGLSKPGKYFYTENFQIYGALCSSQQC